MCVCVCERERERERERWYIYSDIHGIFFAEFPIVLHECLCKIATQQRNFQRGELKEWSPFLIERMKRVNNLISRYTYFWVDSILEGYVTEFLVDTITSYSEAEWNFFKGPHKRYLLSLKMWIKMI